MNNEDSPLVDASPNPSAVSRLIAALLFLSGIAGLIYEVIWTRLFSDILGSTAIAMTVVFSVFLGAMAVGALLFGRVRLFGARALRLFGYLEFSVALTGMVTSTLLIAGRFWIASVLPASGGDLASLGFMLIPAVLLVGIPALAMGGTLPVVLDAVRGWALPQRLVTSLYGWNTLGGACGALGTGLFLIWVLGIRGTLSIAVALNLGVGFAALAAERRMRPLLSSAPQEEEGVRPAGKGVVSLLWLGLAFLSGFTVLGFEILWGRMAKFLLGDRTMAMSILLFVFITCLGLGSLLTRRIAGRYAGTDTRGALRTIAWFLLLASAFHLGLVPVARLTIEGRGLCSLIAVPNVLLQRILAIVILIAPPTLALGTVFPLLIWSARRINQLPGEVLGILYFVNMAGATLGAILTTYALCRWAGTLGGFLILTGVCVFAATLIHVFTLKTRGQKLVIVPATLAAFAAASLVFPGNLVLLHGDERLIEANEDEYGVQELMTTAQGFLRMRNNRLHLVYDFGNPETAYAQQIPAHLTVLLAANCRRVINIGTGYGITAGTFTLYPDVQSIETVEILPFVAKHQSAFASGNFDYLKDRRATLIEGDGRHQLLKSRERYDIISVNVLDPYLPGSSALFTTDFWREVKKRLNPGGVYTQLLWGNDVPLLVKGLRTVFPRILFLPCYGGSAINVVCVRDLPSDGYAQVRLERLSPRADVELSRLFGLPAPQGLQALLQQSAQLEERIIRLANQAAGRLHTDDHPILEYRWAHGVQGVPLLDSPLVVQ